MMTTHDVLGVLDDDRNPMRSQTHFDVGDGWELILPGEELRRPRSLQRVAITRVEITFSSEEHLSTFLEIIRQSDERLSQVPDSEAMYDWQNLRRKGLTVRFGVAWYDQEFYRKRKDAHRSGLHEGIFIQFGTTPSDLRIEHIPL
jgi:hypothetical protein